MFLTITLANGQKTTVKPVTWALEPTGWLKLQYCTTVVYYSPVAIQSFAQVTS